MKLILSFALIILAGVYALAQEKVKVEVSEKEMSEGTQTAFTVLIPESSQKVVKKEWAKFINERSIFDFATKGTSQTLEKAILSISNIFSNEKKTYSKKSLKMEERGNELLVHNVLHEDISNLHLDVFAQISTVESGVYLNSFFKYADSIFISESNVSEDTYNTIKEYVRQFGVETYKVVVANQVKQEEKELANQENILNDSQQEVKQLVRAIGRYETKIDEYRYNIKVLERDLEGTEERLSDSKTALRLAEKKSEEYDLRKANMKAVEKEHKRNRSDQKSNKNKIKKNQSNIEDAQNEIIANEKLQETQKEVIAKQMLRVEEFEAKLENIK